MARKKFREGFKEEVLLYHETHSDQTIKACAAKFDIGYSTLRRWIAEKEEENTASIDNNASIAEQVEEVPTEKKVEVEVQEVPAQPTEAKEAMTKESAPVVSEPEFIDHQEAVEVFYMNEDDVENDENGMTQMDVLKHELKGMASSVKRAAVGAAELAKLYQRRYYLRKVRQTLENETRKRYQQAHISEGE